MFSGLLKGAATAGVMALLIAGAATPARAAAATYDQFSRVFERSAGQFWADGRAGGQWAWNPRSATESAISWGDPANWPPDGAEEFVRSGDWLLLDGWSDNGTYYTQRVTRELIGDARCENLKALPSDGGRQHYAQWTVPGEAYCLKAWGTITEKSSGRVIDFGHTQIWSPPAACANQYLGAQTCVKQWESWWDNRGRPGQPISRVLDRDQYLAKGIGMAFIVQQFYPKPWRAELRYHWTWTP
ncbi:hypothetical protein [Phytohabitans aurantiacus]|uniref:Uncharacterized protein n=1 Tax=Phytohabitans aurantiacus TaxID=3016789 RepID=A0ABQ5QPK7_9ACTN|nr:hypothetical protein [Phytohabitans aurantiacus]GLH96324.1 hypothetical protein Pa4123_15980 [Phytohabitans aurantiacus]